MSSNPQIAYYLLENNLVDIPRKSKSVLFKAFELDDTSVVKILINKYNLMISDYTVQKSIQYGNINIFELLINESSIRFDVCLEYAIIYNQINIIEIIINNDKLKSISEKNI